MGKITTVLGDIESGALGFCQCHEHLFLARGQSCKVNPDICMDDIQKSAAELALYHAAGGQAVVDAQPVGCGRDALVLGEISQKSGVHLIASTGFHKLMFYQEGHWIFTADEDRLAEIFISELQGGMYALCDTAAPQERTGSRVGQIKTALDMDMRLSDVYRKLFNAATIAARETGRPMMVHIDAGTDPAALANSLVKEGMRPQQLIFCHLDRAIPDLGVHRELCAGGITLEYDTIARPKYHDDARETEILIYMLEGGYEDQIVMSLDTTRARLKSYGGTVGLDYILLEYTGTMKKAGVSDGIIEKIFVGNPAKVYAR